MSNNNAFEPPDGGYGWVVVLSTTMISISVMPLINNLGIIFQNEFKQMGITATQTSFLFHLQSAMYCSFGLISSPLLKIYTYRPVAFLGTFLMCLGILLTSFANSYTFFIITMALTGIGQGILLPATYVATSSYFRRKLTLAICFSVTGTGIATIFMPFVCTKLVLALGRRSTVLILFAISLLAIIFCCLLKPIKKETENLVLENTNKNSPSENNTLLNDEVVYKTTTLPVKEKKSVLKTVKNLFNLELLKDRPYVITTLGLSTSFASELNVILLLPLILKELAKRSDQEIATIISTLSLADVFGRLVIPLGGSFFKISPRIMYGTALLISTTARTVLACYQSQLALFLCAVLFGLGKGTKAVYQSVLIPKLVSLDKLPAANGLNMLLTGCLSLLLGPILGAAHDVTNSYVYELHAGSFISLFCVFLWIVDYCCLRKSNPDPEN